MRTLLRINCICAFFWLVGFQPLPVLGQSCRLDGYIKGLANKPVVFGYQQKGVHHTDTVFAHKDRFTYVAKPSDDGQITLTIVRGQYASFWYEPGTIKAVGLIDRPNQLTFTGTPENTILTRYNQTISWPYDRRRHGNFDSLRLEEQRETLRFIQQHPTARTSADLLYWQTFYNEEPIDRYEKLLADLAPSVKTSNQGKKSPKGSWSYVISQ